MLDKLSVRERNLLVLLLAIVFIGLVYFGLFKYLYPQYREAKNELELKHQYLDDVNARIGGINNLEDENGELNQRLESLTASFNKEIRNGVNYYFIGKHAVDKGVIIRELIPKPYEDYEKYIRMPLDIVVRGKYRNALDFIRMVEKDMPNTSEIISLDIHPSGWDNLSQEKDNENGGNQSEETYLSVIRMAQESDGGISKLLSDTDPDVDVLLTLVTYVVKSPENMVLAESKPLGRTDAFSPSVEIPAILPETPEEEPDGGRGYYSGNYDDDDWEDTVNVSGGSTNIPEDENEGTIGETDNSPIPQVIIKEAGNYSFPVRDNRDKEAITNED